MVAASVILLKESTGATYGEVYKVLDLHKKTDIRKVLIKKENDILAFFTLEDLHALLGFLDEYQDSDEDIGWWHRNKSWFLAIFKRNQSAAKNVQIPKEEEKPPTAKRPILEPSSSDKISWPPR